MLLNANGRIAGASAPAKPTLSHTASGQFTITDYDATFTYDLSVTAGSISRAGAVVTMTNADSVGSVYARRAPGAPRSTVATGERKTYSVVQGGADTSYLHGFPEHGDSIPGTIGARWTTCHDVGGGTGSECGHQEGYMVKGALPGGYSDSFGEWWKVA